MNNKNFIVLFYSLVVVACLAGCFPPTSPATCEQHDQAERVGLAYEELFDDELSDEEWSCMHSFEVAYGTPDEINEFCHVPWNEVDYEQHGCFRPTPLRAVGPVIMVDPNEHESSQIFTLRHELIHLLIWCKNDGLTATSDSHSEPEWFPAYEHSGWDMTILLYAGHVEATTYVCE